VAVTVALEVAGISAYNHVTNAVQPRVAIPLSERDDWQHETELKPDLFASGKASWYDASKNNAWYTRETEWGAPVEFYAAAGPDLRALVQALYTTKINWGGHHVEEVRRKGYPPTVYSYISCYRKVNSRYRDRLVRLL
jgi:hypothetical protein